MSGSSKDRGEHPALHGNLTEALSRWGAELQARESPPKGAPPPLREGELVAGRILGRYELEREIRYGDFPAWEAVDGELHRQAAVLPFSVAWDDVAAEPAPSRPRAGLEPEDVEKLARLSHANLISLWDVGLHEGNAYLAMELYPGSTLAQKLERGRLPIAEALAVAVEIAKGLAHAHRHGVVHGNLRPANVLFGEPGLKLLGTGLLPPSDLVPSAVAPEQVAGARGDTRSDVFALGVILFQMLTGELPFPGRSEATRSRGARRLQVGLEASRSWWRRVAHAIGIASSSGVKDDAAQILEDLVNRMLAADPAARPQSEDVLHSLEIVQRRIGRLSTPPTVATRGAPEECEEFDADMEEVAFRGELPQGALKEHIAWCRSCAEKWDHERSLYAHPPELEAGVLEAARREASRIHGKTPAPPGRVRASVAAEGRRSPELPGTDAERLEEARAALERFGPKVFGYLRAVLIDDERSQEAFSLFAEMLWREVPESTPIERVWAFRLAYRAATSVSERNPERKCVAVTEEQKIFASLSSEEQMIVTLRVDQGVSWEEIASVIGTDTESAMKRFEDLKERLRTRLRLA